MIYMMFMMCMLMDRILVFVKLCLLDLQSNIILFICLNDLWAVYVHKLDPSDCQGVIDAFGEQYCGLYIYMKALWAVYVT